MRCRGSHGALPVAARLSRGRRRPVTLSLRHEVLRLALRDPFRIARSDHDAGHAVTTVVVELRDEPCSRTAVGLGEGYPDRFYGETADDDGRRLSRCLLAARRARSSRPARRPARRARSARGRGGDAAGSPTAAPSARSTPRSTTSSARSPASRSIGCSGCRPTSRRPTSRSGSTSRRSSPSGPDARRASRRSRSRSAGRPTSRRSRRFATVYDKPIRVDANTGWTPETARALLPALGRPRRRAHRAAVPGRPARLAAPTSSRARRCRSWPTSRA